MTRQPNDRGRPPRDDEGRATPGPTNAQEVGDHTNATEFTAIAVQLRRRRAASYGLPPWRDACSCRDPWICRCDEPATPSDRLAEAYEAAAESLLHVGMTPAPFLPEMRVMWRKGQRSRELVQSIAEHWQVVA